MPKKTKPTRGIRKHNHYCVTVTYKDNEISGRVYNNREKAEKFAAREVTVAVLAQDLTGVDKNGLGTLGTKTSFQRASDVAARVAESATPLDWLICLGSERQYLSWRGIGECSIGFLRI